MFLTLVLYCTGIQKHDFVKMNTFSFRTRQSMKHQTMAKIYPENKDCIQTWTDRLFEPKFVGNDWSMQNIFVNPSLPDVEIRVWVFKPSSGGTRRG